MPAGRPSEWTPEDSAFVEKYWATKSNEWIAAQLGKKRGNVYRHATGPLGLPKRSRSPKSVCRYGHPYSAFYGQRRCLTCFADKLLSKALGDAQPPQGIPSDKPAQTIAQEFSEPIEANTEGAETCKRLRVRNAGKYLRRERIRQLAQAKKGDE